MWCLFFLILTSENTELILINYELDICNLQLNFLFLLKSSSYFYVVIT